MMTAVDVVDIVALRNEKGSYNQGKMLNPINDIVALRNEKGSYNRQGLPFYA